MIIIEYLYTAFRLKIKVVFQQLKNPDSKDCTQGFQQLKNLELQGLHTFI